MLLTIIVPLSVAMTLTAARYIFRSCDLTSTSHTYSIQRDLPHSSTSAGPTELATTAFSAFSANLSNTAEPALLANTDTSLVKFRNHHIVFNTSSGLFHPDSPIASTGDLLSFYFAGSDGSFVNTSIIQSQYNTPCAPLRGGIDPHPIFSGPIIINTTVAPIKFVMNLTTTDPIWFYASGNALCRDGASMVVNQLPENYRQTLLSYRAGAAGIAAIRNNTLQGSMYGGTWKSTTGDSFAENLAKNSIGNGYGNSSASSVVSTSPLATQGSSTAKTSSPAHSSGTASPTSKNAAGNVRISITGAGWVLGIMVLLMYF